MAKQSNKRNAAKRRRRRAGDRERAAGRRGLVHYNPYPTSVAGTRGGIFVAAVLMLLFSFYLIASLFNIQVLSNERYRQEAADLRFAKTPVYPERGAIYDSEGQALAVTTYDYTVGITPASVRSWLPEDEAPRRVEVVAKIAEILGIPQSHMEEYMADEEATYTQIKKNVPVQTADQLRVYLRENQIGGVVLDAVMRREYPQKKVGASIVGFASKIEDNISGVMGLESYYDAKLRGQVGYTYAQVDNYSGMQMPFTASTTQEAQDGWGLKLHINARIQAFCQNLIRQYVHAYGAEEGEIVVVNPKTGAVIAMANHTSFDLNQPFAPPEGQDEASWDPFSNNEQMDYLFEHLWRNRATQILYEPGSTYKSFTTAMAMEENIFKEDEVFNDEPIWVEGHDAYPISCWSGSGHGWETVRDALVRSCNPVMVQLAQRLGQETFYDYVRALGHRERTGVDLPEESYPALHGEPNPSGIGALTITDPDEVAMPIDLANLSFGESSVITPLHLINAFAVFGNGGVLMRPQVLDAYVDKDKNIIQDVQPEEVRRVFSTQTAERMMDYLRSVVTDYEGAPEGETPGYGSVGKTSTSNHGEDDQYAVISFANMAPYYDPKVAVLCVLHRPDDGVLSRTTAKMSAQVASYALEHLGVQRDKSLSSDMDYLMIQRQIPNLAGYTYATAPRQTLPANIVLDMEPNAPAGASVRYQYPPAGELVNNRGTLYVSHSGKPLTEVVTVPNFANLGYESVYKLADEMGLNLLVLGSPSGRCSSQSIEAGKSVLKYSVVEIYLD